MHLQLSQKAKHHSVSKLRTESSLPPKKNSLRLSWTKPLIIKLKSLPNTSELYILDQVLISVFWPKSLESLFKLISSNITNQWLSKLFADKLLSLFNKRHKQEDTDLSVFQSQLLVMMKMDHIWFKSILQELFITGKPQLLEKMLKMPRFSQKKDTNPKCKLKMQFTLLL